MLGVIGNKNHTHTYEVNQKGDQGRCKCGQIVQYSSSDNLRDSTVAMVKAGDPHYKDTQIEMAARSQAAALIQQQAMKNTPSTKPAQVEPVPQKPARTLRTSTFNRLNEQKAEIIKDYQGMALVPFLRKWHITGQTWVWLRKDWGVTPKGKGRRSLVEDAKPSIVPTILESESKNLPETKPESHTALPNFPAFSYLWTPEVQLAWIAGYLTLWGKQNG